MLQKFTTNPNSHQVACQQHITKITPYIMDSVFTARCTLVQSAVLRSHVVCPSVRPYVC